MSYHETLLAVVVLVPFVGSFFLPFIGRVSERLRNGVALTLILVALIAALMLIPAVLHGAIPIVSVAGIDIYFADKLALFMSLVSLGVGSIIVL